MNNTWGMVKKNLVVHLTEALLVALVAFVGSAWLEIGRASCRERVYVLV